MICPKCKYKFANPIAQAGGMAGGKARVPKGFSCPDVQHKAQKARANGKEARQ